MKLYAITTSERASKGQGGNNRLVVNFTVEHDDKTRQEIGYIVLERQHDQFVLLYENERSEGLVLRMIDIKGEEQNTA